MSTTTTEPTTAGQMRWIRQDIDRLANAIVVANQRAIQRLHDLATALDQLKVER